MWTMVAQFEAMIFTVFLSFSHFRTWFRSRFPRVWVTSKRWFLGDEFMPGWVLSVQSLVWIHGVLGRILSILCPLLFLFIVCRCSRSSVRLADFRSWPTVQSRPRASACCSSGRGFLLKAERWGNELSPAPCASFSLSPFSSSCSLRRSPVFRAWANRHSRVLALGGLLAEPEPSSRARHQIPPLPNRANSCAEPLASSFLCSSDLTGDFWSQVQELVLTCFWLVYVLVLASVTY